MRLRASERPSGAIRRPDGSQAARRLLHVPQLLAFHDDRQLPPTDDPLWHWIALNHRSNASLWHEEDLVRRLDVPHADIVANKRAIDRHNQIRNDAVERIDERLLHSLASRLPAAKCARGKDSRGAASAAVRLHSETPGSMIDRLSILSLKIRAMAYQAARTDAPAGHADVCAARLARLREQRADLAQCLSALLADAIAGRVRFKVYRQFKLYNDPATNPALSARAGAVPPGSLNLTSSLSGESHESLATA